MKNKFVLALTITGILLVICIGAAAAAPLVAGENAKYNVLGNHIFRRLLASPRR